MSVSSMIGIALKSRKTTDGTPPASRSITSEAAGDCVSAPTPAAASARLLAIPTSGWVTRQYPQPGLIKTGLSGATRSRSDLGGRVDQAWDDGTTIKIDDLRGGIDQWSNIRVRSDRADTPTADRDCLRNLKARVNGDDLAVAQDERPRARGRV